MAKNPLYSLMKADKQPKPMAKKVQQEPEEEGEKETQSYGRSSNPLIGKLMGCQQSLAMCHWLTTSFAEHKALGEAYETLADSLDNFVETLIGAKSRSVLSGIKQLQITTDVDEALNELEGTLRDEVEEEVEESETALLNIRDDMLALVQHTRYLLTLG